MMRQIDLLPASHAEKRRARRNLGLVVTGGIVVLVLMAGWWFMLGTQVSDAKNELADVQAQNASLQQQIAELQRFADLEAEVVAKEQALKTVMAGDIAWPSVLTEVAMEVPSEVWLKGISASAATLDATTQVGTETAPIRVADKLTAGRISFEGSSLTMPGVAKWMVRLQGVREFQAVFLDVAQEATQGESGQKYFDFTTTLELTPKATSGRFLGGQQP
jgi:Tfp pilus assembly protein PilN